MRRRLPTLVLATTLVTLGSGAATAAPGPGRYVSKGDLAFSFTVVRGTCASPPARVDGTHLGKARKGLCYLGGTEPQRDLPCEGGGKIIGDSPATDPGYATGLRLSAGGKLHFRRFEYGGSKEPDGYTDLRMTVKGRTATGVIRRTSRFTNDTGVHTCDSGPLRFTARRGS